jgi:hypothetical protein
LPAAGYGGQQIVDGADECLFPGCVALAAHAEAEEMNRVYAMNLAMIRKAAQLTQVEVARRLGVGQAASRERDACPYKERGSCPGRTGCERRELVNIVAEA